MKKIGIKPAGEDSIFTDLNWDYNDRFSLITIFKIYYPMFSVPVHQGLVSRVSFLRPLNTVKVFFDNYF